MEAKYGSLEQTMDGNWHKNGVFGKPKVKEKTSNLISIIQQI